MYMYSHPIYEGRGWLSTVPQATSKRNSGHKESTVDYLKSPIFLASWAHHRCGWFPVMSYLCRPPPPPKQYHPILLKFAFFLLYAQTDLNQPCSYLPVKPAIWILFMNPARWFPHFQASSTFDFVCIDFIAIQWWSNLRFDVQSLKPVRGKFLVHLRRILLACELS